MLTGKTQILSHPLPTTGKAKSLSDGRGGGGKRVERVRYQSVHYLPHNTLGNNNNGCSYWYSGSYCCSTGATHTHPSGVASTAP